MRDIRLTPERRSALTAHLQSVFRNDFDEDLTPFRAEAILDAMLKAIGPAVYNQAVADVRDHFQTKLDDLDGEIHVDDLA